MAAASHSKNKMKSKKVEIYHSQSLLKHRHARRAAGGGEEAAVSRRPILKFETAFAVPILVWPSRVGHQIKALLALNLDLALTLEFLDTW